MKLTLQQKLVLSKRSHHLTVFDDRAVLKAYNESAYILAMRFSSLLQPLIFKLKHKPFHLVAMLSINRALMLNSYPMLQKTQFGYELVGEFDLSGYSQWLLDSSFCCGLPQ